MPTITYTVPGAQSQVQWLSVVYDGSAILSDSVLYFDGGLETTLYTQGRHDGGAASNDLVDSSKTALWANDDWIGYTVLNTENEESAEVTDSTDTIVVGALSGAETWDNEDGYLLMHPTILRDDTKSWVPNEWQNLRLINVSDGSTGIISSNTDKTITVSSLSGGALNTWRIGDDYRIISPIDTSDKIEYESLTNQGGAVSMSVNGVPSITGVNGTHTFSIRLVDVSDGDSTSAEALITVTV